MWKAGVEWSGGGRRGAGLKRGEVKRGEGSICACVFSKQIIGYSNGVFCFLFFFLVFKMV